MYNSQMVKLGKKRSEIRELFEYGNELKKTVGEENVFDFTLGNPSVPTPAQVNETIISLIQNDPSVHAYTSAQGLASVREKIASFSRETYGLPLSANHIYITSGAAAALAISLKATITEEQNEVIVFAPFFPEYAVFIANAGGTMRIVPMDESNFQINFEALDSLLNEKTAAVIINSPNNPSGIVYTPQTLQRLSQTLTNAEKAFCHPIILISDEPYREIVFTQKAESPLSYYSDCVLCYSYSKAFSIPGERIGYIGVSDHLQNADDYYAAVMGAGRSLGYVCASSLFQRVVAECINVPSDIEAYKINRDLFIENLSALGFWVANPEGAFYLLVKAPNGDAKNFCERAKKFGLLVVPTDSFGAPGYVRIATCVSTQLIRRALPAFSLLAKEYFN